MIYFTINIAGDVADVFRDVHLPTTHGKVGQLQLMLDGSWRAVIPEYQALTLGECNAITQMLIALNGKRRTIFGRMLEDKNGQ